jgi:hypothetical protein
MTTEQMMHRAWDALVARHSGDDWVSVGDVWHRYSLSTKDHDDWAIELRCSGQYVCHHFATFSVEPDAVCPDCAVQVLP